MLTPELPRACKATFTGPISTAFTNWTSSTKVCLRRSQTRLRGEVYQASSAEVRNVAQEGTNFAVRASLRRALEH